MNNDDKHSLYHFSAALSALVHAWIIGLSFHYWIEPSGLGAWFVIPFLLTMFATWFFLMVGIVGTFELLGWWD